MKNTEKTESGPSRDAGNPSFNIGPALEKTARARDAGFILRDAGGIFRTSDQAARCVMLRRLGTKNHFVAPTRREREGGAG